MEFSIGDTFVKDERIHMVIVDIDESLNEVLTADYTANLKTNVWIDADH